MGATSRTTLHFSTSYFAPIFQCAAVWHFPSEPFHQSLRRTSIFGANSPRHAGWKDDGLLRWMHDRIAQVALSKNERCSTFHSMQSERNELWSPAEMRSCMSDPPPERVLPSFQPVLRFSARGGFSGLTVSSLARSLPTLFSQLCELLL